MSLLLLLTASAQNYDGHGFNLTPVSSSPSDGLTTWRPSSQTLGQGSFIGLFEYAKSPLVLIREDGDGNRERLPLLDDVVALNLGGTVGLHERVAVSLAMPLFFTASGQTSAVGPAAGDLRLSVPIGLVLVDEGFSLGVVPQLDAPIGAGGRYLGDRGVGFGGLLAARYNTGPIDFSANLGAESTGSAPSLNLKGGPRILSALGIAYTVIEGTAVHVEGTFRPTLSSNDIAVSESPAEALLSVRSRFADEVFWTVGASTGLTRGATAAQFRAFAGIGLAFGRDPEVEPVPPPVTVAELGIKVVDVAGGPIAGAAISLDGVDVGITESAGNVTVSELEPETTPILLVRAPEGDGYKSVQLTLDPLVLGPQKVTVELPYEPGIVRVKVTANGEPADAIVQMQGHVEHDPVEVLGEAPLTLEPGPWDIIVIADGYGTQSQTVEVLPDQESAVEIDFKLVAANVELTIEEVVTLQQVQFDFDSAKIDADSLPLLNEIAANLKASPELKTVEVQGHSDSKGEDDYNMRLSQRRVEAVVSYLEAQGVERDRVVPIGYGEECPLVVENSPEDMAVNRRVQFIIIDPAPTDGIPCHEGVSARKTGSRTFIRRLDDQTAPEQAPDPAPEITQPEPVAPPP